MTRKSTLYGGVRAVGRTAPEAIDLWGKFRTLEDAGAFAEDAEVATVDAKELRRVRSLLDTDD